MDSYQAVYDATRSRIGTFDGHQLVEEIVRGFDFSYHADMIKNEVLGVIYEYQRPSVFYRPKLFLNGNQWVALYGENLKEGCAGFGDTPEQAMRDFDANWKKKITKDL